ncbi:MAG: NFACT family protein [Ruminococcus sp.]|nr:NFACT family protein [Ruminococcus sp.]
MALDGIFLSLVKEELAPLIGGRIDKVYQTAREELVLGVRTRDGSYRLLINSSAGTARVHVTGENIENPKTPPMFCMLMRKRLGGGRLVGIRQDGAERIICFDIDAVNEMGDTVRLTLAAEIMGRRSNIILIEYPEGAENGRIVDSIKRVTPEMSSVRPVLPGMEYTLPPRGQRLSLESFTAEELREHLAEFAKKRTSSALVQSFEGISPVFADEAVWYMNGGEDKAAGDITDGEFARLTEWLTARSEELKSRKLTYTALLTAEGTPKDFCFAEIKHFGSLMQTKRFESACELLDEFYSRRSRDDRIRQKAADLFAALTSLIERTSRRVANQRQELTECADREQLKIRGDLIMTNLYAIQKGQTIVICDNYYSEDGGKLDIELDPRLTPTQNAQKYYREYRKADTAEKKLAGLIAEGEQELVYLDSVLDQLTRAETDSDIDQLRGELAEQGYLRRRTRAGQKEARSLPPLKFISDDGYTILVGRHNRQNDKLTLKDSAKQDIWLHTHDITGSHTVIVTNGKDPNPPRNTIMQAARLAAYHSKGRQSSQVPVDYTLIKNVKKPNGAKPGMVIFTDQRTVYVTPDEKEAERLRIK